MEIVRWRNRCGDADTSYWSSDTLFMIRRSAVGYAQLRIAVFFIVNQSTKAITRAMLRFKNVLSISVGKCLR